jgi:putative ABC transport system permease protein
MDDEVSRGIGGDTGDLRAPGDDGDGNDGDVGSWQRCVRRHLPPLRVTAEREAEIVDELALQLEQACLDALAGGASEGEARERALAGLPPWEELAREIDEAHSRSGRSGPSTRRRQGARPRPTPRGGPLSGALRDLRHALRLLRKRPAFAGVALATLAFGIGINAAVFTVIDAVELRGLPFPAAGRLMAIETHLVHQPEEEPWTSAEDFFDVRERARSFSRVAAVSPVWNVVLTGGAEAQRLECLYVSADFFPALGVRPVLGRGVLARDDERGKPSRVAVLGHGFWRRRFGASPGALGKTLELDGKAYAVVGVLPAGFRYPGEPLLGTAAEIDLWLPLADNELMAIPQRSLRFLKVLGRRRAAVTAAGAREELRRIGAQLAQEHPASNRGVALGAQPLAGQVKGRYRTSLLLLAGAVAFVLLMACANVANLVLARNVARRQEMTVRIALGAAGGRLLRQLLIEGLALASLGGALGLAVAQGCLRALAAAAPPGLLPESGIALDARSLLFTVAAVLGCAVLAGLLPGWHLLRLEISALTGGFGAAGRILTAGSRRLRGALVTFETAVALMLLVGAGLLISSFLRLLAVDPGFAADRLVTLSTQTPPAARSPEQRAAVLRAVLDRLAAVPGVRGVGAVSRLPLMGSNISSTLWIEGSATPEADRPGVEYRVATPGYFQAMGIALRSGRRFDARDDALSAAPVALINQSLARRFWPGQDPVGRRIKLGANQDRKPWTTIVGVVGDVRHFGLDVEPRPEVYVPYAHSPLFAPILVVRTATDPAPMVRELGEAVRSAAPGLPVYNVAPMRELMERSTAQRRFLMWLLTAFAVAALLLAAVGVYGIVSQSVAQRTREIGLRMALGARPAAALRLMALDGLRSMLPGLAVGVAGAMGLSRTMRSVLFEVGPLDPVVFAAAAVTLGLCGALACYVPARRATRVDPLAALRHE